MSAINERVTLFFTRSDDASVELHRAFSVEHGAIPAVGDKFSIGLQAWRVEAREWSIGDDKAIETPMRVTLRLAQWIGAL